MEDKATLGSDLSAKLDAEIKASKPIASLAFYGGCNNILAFFQTALNSSRQS